MSLLHTILDLWGFVKGEKAPEFRKRDKKEKNTWNRTSKDFHRWNETEYFSFGTEKKKK